MALVKFKALTLSENPHLRLKSWQNGWLNQKAKRERVESEGSSVRGEEQRPKIPPDSTGFGLASPTHPKPLLKHLGHDVP